MTGARPDRHPAAATTDTAGYPALESERPIAFRLVAERDLTVTVGITLVQLLNNVVDVSEVGASSLAGSRVFDRAVTADGLDEVIARTEPIV